MERPRLLIADCVFTFAIENLPAAVKKTSLSLSLSLSLLFVAAEASFRSLSFWIAPAVVVQDAQSPRMNVAPCGALTICLSTGFHRESCSVCVGLYISSERSRNNGAVVAANGKWTLIGVQEGANGDARVKQPGRRCST